MGATYLLTADWGDAEDVAQEAFARVYTQWHRVGRMTSPVGYLYRVAFNVNRRRMRRAMGLIRRLPLLVNGAPDEIEAANERRDVLSAVLVLSPRQREVVVMTEWVGLSTEEIASILRIAPSSVRATLARGREAIRQRLGDAYA